jgi:hypothetical protein
MFGILCGSCEKNIKVELPKYQQRVVIEGSIETGQPCVVFLSYSVPYFGEFDFSQPQQAFIKGAFVTVSDGFSTDTLKEVDPNTGYLYAGLKMLGIKGRTYTLRVTVNNKTFYANTQILNPVALDSLFFKGEQDSLGLMWQRLTEPEGVGDYYRWFAKRLRKDDFYAAPFNSAFEDKFVDGKSFEFAYDRGPQPNALQEFRDDPEAGYYKRGDTVVVKFCKIGRKEYDFWFTYYQNKASNSNPFSAPANVKSTFENELEVFGAFVGYAPAFDTIVIP